MILCDDVVVVVPHYSYNQNIELIVSELGEHFVIVVVNDGPSFFSRDGVTVLNTERVGFSKVVNRGLSYAQSKMRKWNGFK